MPASDWAGLPAEFAPPAKAAKALAELDTLAERELYFGRIPKQWHPMISDLAKIGIAAKIVSIPGKEGRQRALAEVPENWQVDVRQHVLRLWGHRQKFGTMRAA